MKSLRIRMAAVVIFGIGLLIAEIANGVEEDANSGVRLNILLVSEFQDGEAQGIRALLEKHNVTVTVAGWREATAERARRFDLTIIGGSGRQVRAADVVLDYEGAVLGLGSYGCKYFGLLKLKNGHPYT